jgi:hypothetical protein
MKTIKVCELVRARRNRYGKDTRTAQIRLSGKWLESAGFTANSKTVVTVEPGQIIIRLT